MYRCLSGSTYTHSQCKNIFEAWDSEYFVGFHRSNEVFFAVLQAGSEIEPLTELIFHCHKLFQNKK